MNDHLGTNHPTPEQLEWIERYIPLIEKIEAMGPDRSHSFERLCDQILEEKFGSFPIVANALGRETSGETKLELLPFLVPIIEDLLELLAAGNLVETTTDWVVIDPNFRLDAESLGVTGTELEERFEEVARQLRDLEKDERTELVDSVFTIIETSFADHPGIAEYYATNQPNAEAAALILPLFEAFLVAHRDRNP